MIDAIGVPSTTAEVVDTDEPLALLRLYDPGTGLVVLRRAVDDGVVAAARDLQQASARKWLIQASTEASSIVGEVLAHGLPAALAHDVSAIALLFGDLIGASTLGIRIAVVQDALCPRFHTDRVEARAVCTYAGPGTEWVGRTDYDRRFVGHGARGMADHESGLLRPGARIRAVERYALAIFKGEAWSANASCVLHRSPASDSRVVVTIDALA